MRFDHTMEDDDEFGDLYTDVLRQSQEHPPPASNPNPSPGVGAGKKDEKIVFGSSQTEATALESSVFQERQAASPEGADGDWLLGREPLPVVEPVNWVDDDGEEVLNRDRVLEKEVGRQSSGVSIEGGDASCAEGSVEKRPEIRNIPEVTVIPGISAITESSNVQNGELVKASWSDDWDSGSEDDLQIVLNDTNHDLQEEERRGRGGGYEDDEDLVIVTDEDQHLHQQAMEEQGWGNDTLQPSADGEKKEMLDAGKATGVEAKASGGGIGYSNHSFHLQHHSMFKYVRPGAAPAPRGPVMAASGPPGQVHASAIGSFSGRGRGDWRPVGGNGFPNSQKGFLPGYGLPSWGSSALGRPFGGGLDFTLPSHKTVFDIDIESFEEKPWRYPGVDISDFFNFGLDEEHWKEYCKQVEQLRLESTMQSKIRVYESGRSEQNYDPDLPPELAAATGHSNLPADNTNHGKSDNVQGDLSGQERGTVCMRPPLPTGRAIQVEGGYGERLPSIDTRPPRIRDSDAIIEIVLQDNLDDPSYSNGSLERPTDNFEGENVKGCDVDDEDDGPAESEYYGRFPRSSNGQQRESMERRGDGMFFPSDSSRQYNSSPKSETPADTSMSFGTEQGVRLSQRTSCGKDSSISKRSSETLPSRNLDLDSDIRPHIEKTSNEMGGNQAPDLSPSDIDENSRKLSMEPKDVERDDRFTLGDNHEGNGEEASDFIVSSETVGDDGLINSANRQKSSSCIEQSTAQDNVDGNYSRLTQSDNSQAKSENSKDYQKDHESGEEVMQDHPSKRTGDFHKHHEEDIHIGRDSYGRHGRRERDRARSRVTETMHQSYTHKDWDSGSGHTFRGRSEGFERELDGSVSAWQRREDDNHIRQVKNEDVRRGHNEEIRPMERSNVRVTDRKEKVEDCVKKRVDDGDWRGHNRDGALRHRERDNILLSRRENIEDSLMKRKRVVEFDRRQKIVKEDSLHGCRVREDSSRRKRSRDDIVEHRKREDDVRAKSKIEVHHSSKHKDDNWYQRDREVRQPLKLSHDATIVLREKDERQLASRSGRPIEGKALAGRGRSKEDLKVTGSDKDYHNKDRKLPNEQVKRGDRTGEVNESSNKAHGDDHIHARDKRLNTEHRIIRHERSSGHTDGKPVEGRHRESSRKIKNSEPVGQNREVSGKRKHEDHSNHRTKLNSKGSREESNRTSTTEGKKVHEHYEQMEASLLPAARHGEEVHASDDESHESRRGRSKLERWTSHKERDYSAIHNNIQPSSIVREDEDAQGEANESVKAADTHKADEDETKTGDALQAAHNAGDDRDRHFDTVAKLKMRSERFKLPILGEKDFTGSKKAEGEVLPPIQNEAASTATTDMDVKFERPARKRRWTGSNS